jgi:hypothetical protein
VARETASKKAADWANTRRREGRMAQALTQFWLRMATREVNELSQDHLVTFLAEVRPPPRKRKPANAPRAFDSWRHTS